MTAPVSRTEPPLLVVDRLRIGYRVKDTFVEALHEVSFEMSSDERLMIIGPSGCGKSTLLRTIGGFQPFNDGRIVFDGRERLEPGPDRAMVFQEFDQLFPWLTVLENVTEPLRYGGISRPEARQRAEEHLALMGLDHAVRRYPHQLSGGMKQRVAIARALALRPRLLLMDEPFGSLDAITRARLQEEVTVMTRQLGVAVLFVTHSIDEALAVGDRVLVLSPPPSVTRALVRVPRSDDRQAERAEVSRHLHELLADPAPSVAQPDPLTPGDVHE